MEKKIGRMKELAEILDKAAKSYYQDALEIMSNLEYDALYDELTALEQETGIILSGSPTQKVGYEILSALPKEAHEQPMLSLDKTKEVSRLEEFMGEQKGVLSWKLDGLTIVLTYEDGKLTKAVTRGNGEIGEVVTNNAKVFQNVPLHISYKGKLVLRGEAIITYSDFEEINGAIENAEEKYKNPRNLCSGSVRQLNSRITAERKVHFLAFSLVAAEDLEFMNSREEQLCWLKGQGFDTVEFKIVTKDRVSEIVEWFSEKVRTNDFPSDGLVLEYDDIAYGSSLGRTAKFPRNAIAFKWADEMAQTTLLDVEWRPSRTGLINPVAIFEPVELEGTTVKRASVHNINTVEELKLGIGDRIEVYKANMIIPQIAKNLTASGNLEIPDRCPACQGPTTIRKQIEVKALYCENPQCPVKKIKGFTHLLSRNALNIEGLSEATLEKFISKGFIHRYGDIFHLDRHQEEITSMEGFGEKSYENLISSVEKARNTTLPRLLYGLGIANVGVANAKLICKAYDYDPEKVIHAKKEDLSSLDNIGEIIAESFTEFFAKEENLSQVKELLKELRLEKIVVDSSHQPLRGKVFVITGEVQQFKNRNAMKEFIEEKGGKVTGSVTSKTSYLINNDITSNSSKNKKARELGIPVLSEKDFMALFN